VLINTWHRDELLLDAISHYSQCPSIDAIRVVWSDRAPPGADSPFFAAAGHRPLRFDARNGTSLNNRFLPLQGLRTDAVFSVDDDIRVPCGDLLFAFSVWQNVPTNLVGFWPRTHEELAPGNFVYRCWWKVWLTGSYSIVLTKAAFLHHRYLAAYSQAMPARIRDYVDKMRNCEDIAMQFLASNISKSAPVFVRGSLTDKGVFNGISTSSAGAGGGHMLSRSKCLDVLAEVYGHMPLRRSFMVAAPAGSWSASAPPTWYEYISSDLWT